MIKKQLLLVTLLYFGFVFSQQNQRKSIVATRVEVPPKIDGFFNDNAWKNVEKATDFVVLKPNNGTPVSKKYATEVRVVYDDKAVYISAKMNDPKPNKIPKEIATRDNRGQADYFLITINPNDDGQNPFQFVVEASGNQLDAKISNGNKDFNWSAVWESAVKITDYGWNAEIKIPYRALRFSNQPIQSWGINFHRRLEQLNSEHTWNHIDNSKGIWTQYDGLLTNIKNIKPPTRLNLYPYASANVKNYKGNTDFNWSAGLDIKYGLSDSFTLDATLIPDFSQTGFDNVTLNLGPFEQQFSEQRQFFIEGTELFTKGDLFYSRRIGGNPIKSIKTTDDEILLKNPEKVNMLNAIKISGRTKGGLGIGFFNAITQKTEAVIKNKITQKQRTEVTNPFSNYNIAVLDYQFNQNSAITLINTNVFRKGNFKDANATGLLWHIETEDSKYNVDGAFKMTNITDIKTSKTGYMLDTSIGKGAGNWFWELGYNFENKDYDPNDMGILQNNNQQAIYGNVGYRILHPKGKFNSYQINLWNNTRFQHYSGMFTGNSLRVNFWAQLKSRFSFGISLNHFTKRKDFFEPREGSLSGIYFTRPQGINFNHWGSSSYQKKLAIDYSFYKNTFKDDNKNSYGFRLKPRYRFNDYFSVHYGFSFTKAINDKGYVDKTDDTIFFGQRNRKIYSNSLIGKYSFSVKSSLSLTFRHNWSTVIYDNKYFELQKNGSLTPIAHKKTDNINFNRWNLDLNYQWQFAPGSQLIALYRNAITPNNNFAPAHLGFFNNANSLFNEKAQHIFSLRMVYFVDYNKLKNVFKS